MPDALQQNLKTLINCICWQT